MDDNDGAMELGLLPATTQVVNDEAVEDETVFAEFKVVFRAVFVPDADDDRDDGNGLCDELPPGSFAAEPV